MSQIKHENAVPVEAVHGHSGSGSNLKKSHVSVGHLFNEISYIQPSSTVNSSLAVQQQIDFYIDGSNMNGYLRDMLLELQCTSSTTVSEVAFVNQWVRRVVIKNKKGMTLVDSDAIQNFFATYLNPAKDYNAILHDASSNGISTAFAGATFANPCTWHIQLYSFLKQAHPKLSERTRLQVSVYLNATNFTTGSNATPALASARLVVIRHALQNDAETVHRRIANQNKSYRCLVPIDAFNEQKALVASTTYNMKLSGLSNQSVAFLAFVAMQSDPSSSTITYYSVVDDVLELKNGSGQVVGSTYTNAVSRNILQKIMGAESCYLLSQKANIYLLPFGDLSCFEGIMSGERAFSGDETLQFKCPSGLSSATYTMRCIGFCYKHLISNADDLELL